MTNISDTLVKDYITESADQEAAKQFEDGLKAGYIDTDAFFTAYDPLIKSAGLSYLFNKDRLLTKRGTYGQIVNCSNDELKKALKKFWVAQFSSNLEPKAIVTKRNNELAEAQTLAHEYELKAIDALEKDNNYDELVNNISTLLNIDVKKNLHIEPEIDSYRGNIRYYISLDNYNGRYGLSKDSIMDPENVKVYFGYLLQHYYSEVVDNMTDNKLKEYIQSINIQERDFDALHIYDKATDTAYTIQRDKDKGNKYIIYTVINHTIERIEPKDMPDFTKVDLVSIEDIVSQASGRCWESRTTDVYYNSSFSKDILDRCAVIGEAYDGGLGETSVTLFDDSEVDLTYRALGMNKCERHNYEYDSSD